MVAASKRREDAASVGRISPCAIRLFADPAADGARAYPPYARAVNARRLVSPTAKNAANLAKHGVSLALGAVVLANPIGELLDERKNYGEPRMNAFGLVEGRLFACTYTIRNGARRIISVPRASRQEQRLWLS